MLIPLDGPSIEVIMKPVTSTMLHSIGYDVATRTLYARFSHGMRLYKYEGFPPDMWESMSRYPSVGKFFNQRIFKGYTGKYVAEVAPK